MTSSQLRPGKYWRGVPHLVVIVAALTFAAATPAHAGDLVEGAKETGKAVGTGVREVGVAGKEIGLEIGHKAAAAGKEIGRTAVKVGKAIGEAAKEGGKAVVQGIKGDAS